MKKMLSMMFLACAVLMAVPALADYPDDCLGEAEPSGDDCGDVLYEGCCDEQNRTLWCTDGELYCLDCGAQEAFCGWMTDVNDWYGCMDSETGEDPSGAFPFDCDGSCDPVCDEGTVCYKGECCTPDCTDKVCGTDGCGGSCGDCGAGKFCTELQACEDLPVCEMVEEIACQETKEGTTDGHENILDGYYCQEWDESGAEVGYMWTAPTDDTVVVTITDDPDDEADLDLFVLEGACTIADCIGYGNVEIEFEATAGTVYYFVIDGFGGGAGAYTINANCMSLCEPDCTDGPCSDDGCKGTCPCETEGDVCYDGECCTPSCDDKQCGDDGCGNMDCGECEEGGTCFENVCHSGPGCEPIAGTPGCGGCPCEDCVCAMDEYCCSTEWDGICVGACIQECGGCFTPENCGDDTCQTEEFENCSNCPGDCPCEEGTACFQGECCTPMCDGQECGDDGCGGSCGECGEGMACSDGVCVESTGPSECLGPEQPSSNDCMGLTYEGCCDDLGRVLWCQDGALFCIDCTQGEGECGWKGEFYDCGTEDGAEDPSGANPKECTECEPSCDGNECGDDGCGGSCGSCEVGLMCDNGVCVDCEPDCTGMDCGDDGCGGTCGDCPEGNTCFEGSCHGGAGCEATGGIGCEGCTCEACVCEIDSYCCETEWDAVCVEICLNDCGGCPIDVVSDCGNGTCDAGEDCTSCSADCACAAGQECVEGVCTCTPMCDGLACGDDGCGGMCGTCADGEDCLEGICQEGSIVDPDVTEQPGEDTTGEPGGKDDTSSETSGCSTSDSGSPMAGFLFLAMMLALVAIRRSSVQA